MRFLLSFRFLAMLPTCFASLGGRLTLWRTGFSATFITPLCTKTVYEAVERLNQKLRGAVNDPIGHEVCSGGSAAPSRLHAGDLLELPFGANQRSLDDADRIARPISAKPLTGSRETTSA